MSEIDFRLMADVLDYYQNLDYQFLDVDWLVSVKASQATCPPDAHTGQFVNNDKCFVASAEQAIIELLLNGKLEKQGLLNRYLVSVTPCVRLNDNKDDLHQECFYKIELSYVFKINKHASQSANNLAKLQVKDKLVNDSLTLFQQLIPHGVAYNLKNSDIEYTHNNQIIELGSYGWRTFDDFCLVYGTGLALPRTRQCFIEGYHKTAFVKGQLGKLSKIQEEVNELRDAENQNSKILQLCELSDLYGAIEFYGQSLGVSMNDIAGFSKLTQNAFLKGLR